MTRRGGVVAAVPGRLTIKVRLPRTLLADVSACADHLDIDPAVLMGDLASIALPEALEEAARTRLHPHLLVRRTSDADVS